MYRLAVVTTDPLIVNWFLRPHLAAWCRFAQVTVMVNLSVPHAEIQLDPRVQIEPVRIQRRIAPLDDMLILFKLFRAFRCGRYVGVYSVAPKAGLLAMIASWLARIPFRCHVFQGEVWSARQGPMRWVLRLADRITATAATDILVVSKSERRFLLRQQVISEEKSRVLGQGSISGVDGERFHPDLDFRYKVRAEHDIPASACVLMYLGRFSRDKGLFTLADAFKTISRTHPNAHLLLVGPDEDDLVPRLREMLQSLAARVRFAGFTKAPERYLAAADVLVLPSLREGFPIVILEAAAAGVPTVASRIYGIEDALIDEVTGLMHEPNDATDLARVMDRLLKEPELISRLGAAARARALSTFSANDVVSRTATYLEERLRQRQSSN